MRSSIEETDQPMISLQGKEYCKGIIYFIILVLGLWATIYYKLNVTDIDNHNYINQTTLTTSLYNNINYLSCDSYLYGCCYIYDKCSIQNNSGAIQFNFIKYKLDPRKIISRDYSGSNCPRFLEIINLYNQYLQSNNLADENCHLSSGGCCRANIICDLRANFNNNNDINTAHLYNIQKNNDRFNIKILLNNTGRNCPSNEDIIVQYNKGFDNNNSIIGYILSIILILLFIGALISQC